jgi:hypothetical protein
MSLPPSVEIVRELISDELTERTVIVMLPPGHDEQLWFTMWVEKLDDVFVWFYSELLRWHVILKRQADGRLIDDRHRVVRVFEYLGEE